MGKRERSDYSTKINPLLERGKSVLRGKAPQNQRQVSVACERKKGEVSQEGGRPQPPSVAFTKKEKKGERRVVI